VGRTEVGVLWKVIMDLFCLGRAGKFATEIRWLKKCDLQHVFVSCDCCNKLPQTGWLKTIIYLFSHCSGSQRSKIKVLAGCPLTEALGENN